MKRSLALLASLLCASSALAQVNSVPQTGVNVANTRQQTYVGTSIGLVPAAAATDVFCIAASPTRTVAIRRIEISGLAGTAIAVPFTILRRAALDTGGTAATGTALPVAGLMNTTNAASGATLTAYTANPTINDASPALLRSQTLVVPTAATPSPDQILWYFGTYNDQYDQGIDLVKGTTQQMCVNLNGSTISTGLLYIDVEWVEQQ